VEADGDADDGGEIVDHVQSGQTSAPGEGYRGQQR
jgi:hypothetical protein